MTLISLLFFVQTLQLDSLSSLSFTCNRGQDQHWVLLCMSSSASFGPVYARHGRLGEDQSRTGVHFLIVLHYIVEIGLLIQLWITDSKILL